MDPNTGTFPPRPTIEQLCHVANTYPIIDHHAHNLILPTHADTVPFETITTEAQGRALRDTFKSLSHLRAAGQLRQLYECGEDADWEDILQQRTEWLRSDPERLHQRCFEGVHALLIDDGLAGPEKVFPYEHHDQYTQAPCKRIIRIESVAERLMERIVRKAKEDDLSKTKFLPDTWVTFTDDYERAIQDAIEDPEVAGFKTVVCYRTGLDMEPDYEESAKAVGYPFERYVKNCVRKRNYRIEKKALNDYLVLRTLEILSERVPHADAFTKPLQFHTGLGDNDISLVEANPAFLQPLIENYPTVPFVLLHGAYPYTREAGYLATVYRHVYLDIGAVFPMLSRDGQGAVLRQAMELVPGSKLLYSSNGHWFAETFWLANLQFRQVWLEILLEYVEKGDLTPFQAMGMTKDILFNNANLLYGLRCEAAFDERVPDVPRQLTFNPRTDPSSSNRSPIVSPVRDPGLSNRADTFENPAVSPCLAPTFPPPPKLPQFYDTKCLDSFRQTNADVKFVYVQWMDYMATVRERIVPMKEFDRMIRASERLEICQGSRDFKDYSLTPSVNTTGQIYIEPDLRSLRRTHNKNLLPSATVLCYSRDEAGKPRVECPRNSLETIVNNLQYNFSTTLLVGFTFEVTFLSRNTTGSSPPYVLLNQTKVWGATATEQSLQLPFISEIVLALEEMDIGIQQLHAESGQGQYSFTLAPLPVLSAVDTLLQARQAITQIAAQHELRATLHPKPLPGLVSAAHARFLLQPPDKDMQFFAGGVLQHLPAIYAFSMAGEDSYERDPDTHATRSAWGTQPHTTPLRRISQGHWHLHPLSSLATPPLALSAILAAGLLGLQANDTVFQQQQQQQQQQDALDDQGRHHHGIALAHTHTLPRNLPEALDALERDEPLREALPRELVAMYVRGKEREMEGLGGAMSEEERR